MKNERGYAMLITILTIVFILILGVGIVTVSSKTLKTTTVERSNQSLYYLAESGVNYKEALILNEIDKIYNEEKQRAISQELTQQAFDTNFNTRVSQFLSSNSLSELDHNDFISTFNGTPNVTVSVTQNGNARNFSISSVAFLNSTNQQKSVQREYKIPDNLLTVTQVEEEVTTITPPSNNNSFSTAQPPTAPNLERADIYVADYLSMAAVPTSNYLARYYVDYSYKPFSSAFEIVPGSNRGNITYNTKFPTNITTPIQYVEPPSSPGSISSKISLTNTTFTMNSNLVMQKLPNFSNKVFNITIPDGETKTLLFDQNFLNYNLSSLRFNVSGNGTLNLVFDKYFELNAGRKFIINTPSSSTKVNLNFKDGATIRGEMVAQGLFVKGRLETTLSAKLIAQNVYISSGLFDKDFHSQVKINNLYIKKGNLNISSITDFYANDIVLKEGDVILNTGAGLIANSIHVLDGDMRSHWTTCLQSLSTIYVPNGTTRLDETSNFNSLYSEKLFLIGTSKINKKTCTASPITIDPNVQDSVPQIVVKKVYNFTTNSLIEKGALIEIK